MKKSCERGLVGRRGVLGPAGPAGARGAGGIPGRGWSPPEHARPACDPPSLRAITVDACLPAARRRTAGPTGSTAARKPAGSASRKRPPAKKQAAGRRAPAKKQSGGALRLLGFVWMGVARGAGTVARSVARRDEPEALGPEHRRDGTGLAVLGLAVVLGASVWTRGVGPVGAGHRHGRPVAGRRPGRRAAGAAAARGAAPAAPPAGARGARPAGHRLVLHARRGARHRHVVGHGTTRGPRQGLPGAGGLAGFAIGAPLEAGVGAVVAVVLLVLLFVFGLLVTTATPLHQVPERLRELGDLMTGRVRGGGRGLRRAVGRRGAAAPKARPPRRGSGPSARRTSCRPARSTSARSTTRPTRWWSSR